MKLLKRISIYSLLLLLGMGCADFLEEEPKSFYSEGNVFSTIDNAEYAINGIYANLTSANSWGYLYTWFGNFGTDESDSQWTGNTNQFSNYSLTPSSPQVYNQWVQAYKGINSANVVISNIQAMTEGTDEERNQLIAEARFLRALIYFDMVRFYGDVPLQLEPIEVYDSSVLPAREDSRVVMDSIIEDLLFAEENLSETALIGRATKWAAKGILAKVYMTHGGYPFDAYGDVTWFSKAADKLREVKNSGMFQIMSVSDANEVSEYGKVFLKSERNSNTEIVFDLNFSGPNYGGGWGDRAVLGFKNMSDNNRYYYIWGQGYVGTEFFYSFHDNDIRYKWSIAPYNYSESGKVRTPTGMPWTAQNKFRLQEVSAGNNGNQNAPILRYADILLMLAECNNEYLGSPDIADADGMTAYDYINEVRSRAQVPLMNDVYLNTVNPTSDYPDGQDADLLYGLKLLSLHKDSVQYNVRHAYYDRAGSTQGKFREAIKMERLWELCFERQRWFDLKRWGTLYETNQKRKAFWGKLADVSDPYNKSNLLAQPTFAEGPTGAIGPRKMQPHQEFMPIPDLERLVNDKLTQNDGY
ncbi:MAG: RagB/SusD family nutrient uptake outer membrane protein [Reichenbachiella sp.]